MSVDSSEHQAGSQSLKRRKGFKFRRKDSKDLGSPWTVILITLLIFLFSQFIAVLFIGIGNGLIHPHSSLSNALNQSAPIQFFYVLLAEGLAAVLTIFVVKEFRGLSLASIGLGRRPKFRDVTRALVGAFAFYVLIVIASIIVNIFSPDINTKEAQDVGFNSLNSSLDQILAFSALVFLPPIGEETLVRGYLYSGLRSRWRFIPAMLVTSVLFGLAHLGSGSDGTPLWVAGIDTFLLSVVLVYLRERTGALYAGMLVHAMNNVVAFGVHFHGVLF